MTARANRRGLGFAVGRNSVVGSIIANERRKGDGRPMRHYGGCVRVVVEVGSGVGAATKG